jgi:8-oxo-dGTP diphosphatase
MSKRNHPFIPVLAAIIRNEKNEILIARRKPHLSNGGLWEFPGGKLHQDEKPEECLKREINEELGIDVDVGSVYHIVNHKKQGRAILLMAYTCDLIGGKLDLIDHDEAKWAESSELLNYNYSEPDIPVAKKLIREYLERHND